MNCPPGKYQVSTVQRVVDDDGLVTRFIASKCTQCPVGYYQDEQGKSSCKPCSHGRTTVKTGVRLQEECVKHCPEGTSSKDGIEPCTAIISPNITESLKNDSIECLNCSDNNNKIYIPVNQSCKLLFVLQ